MEKRKNYNFYELPGRAPTSAQIIENAKEKYGLKAVSSNRPETPLEPRRSMPTDNNSAVTLPPIPNNARKRGSKSYPSGLITKEVLLRSESLHDLKIDSKPISTLDTRRISSGPTERTPPPANGTPSNINQPRRVSVNERGEGDGKEDSPRTPKTSDVELSTSSQEDDQLTIIGSRAETLQSDAFEMEIKPMIESLFLLSHDEAGKMADDLYSSLDSNGIFKYKCKYRSSILKSLFKVLNVNTCPDFLIKISRIILKLAVSGNNLVNILKILYSLSRVESNDQSFLDNNITGLLLDLCNSLSLSSSDAMVLLIGILKALTNSSLLRPHLLELNETAIMSKLLKRLMTYTESTPHLFTEISGCFRNIVDDQDAAKQLIALSVPHLLLQLAAKHKTNSDIILNISRIFSKLSAYEEYCEDLTNPEMTQTFIHLMRLYYSSPDILVRLLFVLSNLCAYQTEIRARLISDETNKVVSHLFERFATAIDVESNAKELDVLLKLVAFIANWSIEAEAAMLLANSTECLESMVKIIEFADRSGDDLATLELIEHTATAVNNLTYHASDILPDSFNCRISSALLHLMRADRQEWMLEACRAYGNLSHDPLVRNNLTKLCFVEMLITILDSSSSNLVYNVCGVLINLLLDADNRALFVKHEGAHKLCEVLEDYIGVNWELSALACQVLHNCTSDTRLEGDTVTRLVNLFSFATDEEWAIANSAEDGLDEWNALFRPVADKEPLLQFCTC